MDPIFIGCSWLRSPKSFTRGSRPFFHCGGGSVERAVAHYFLIQRQRSPSRHLWRVVVERLVGPDFFIFRSERKGEGGKWAKNAQNRPVRAVRGHFGPIFHHFSVLEPSQGHFCITFLLNWVPRSFPRRCVIPRAEFSFLRSNVSVHPRATCGA